eukprot:CAMPEP_0172035086 /NCGR_PEP_ID=MMETSP1041-20130122/21383_1 /TAXON_ID=464988 /ORGANISM="Hemiselmis andersenii, Strain CCMP439" /LENGTH=79 /DNA_ID=CAMNT_0012692105 /DNA_START=51 /DNA_END=287 /DNA_ORIENTATION=-
MIGSRRSPSVVVAPSAAPVKSVVASLGFFKRDGAHMEMESKLLDGGPLFDRDKTPPPDNCAWPQITPRGGNDLEGEGNL